MPHGENPSLPQNPNELTNEANWASSSSGNLVAKAALLFELLPSNEVARLGFAAVAQATTHNPIITASVFAASTMVIEGGGSIVTADLLDAGMGKGAMGRIKNRLDRHKIIKTQRQTSHQNLLLLWLLDHLRQS